MKLQYKGSHDAVEVLVDNKIVVVERDHSHDFPTKVAESLLEQADWSKSSSSKAERSSTEGSK